MRQKAKIGVLKDNSLINFDMILFEQLIKNGSNSSSYTSNHKIILAMFKFVSKIQKFRGNILIQDI
ncbi:hypothetical protein TTHERM_000798149 (macronuclear) [Tetrahymena thermophila SB210]|uniref:Uncharacterized protein n=1 Tax=Tetrahymena thermophila (strain SB210) TaxID=312017 RepID=W7X2B9_TETTS|nr:hypothetical protein TTHERM_000798149 [Tetrahymena thermophila SB210]EWS73355.1 hypothetical protein TTHERM_000798149 [Tetrahymena thermophila SB210]|eukprot:XP_012654127.1 hypothetical protein TTHERM_000798149 [Tetrahymena thermophila SB210]